MRGTGRNKEERFQMDSLLTKAEYSKSGMTGLSGLEWLPRMLKACVDKVYTPMEARRNTVNVMICFGFVAPFLWD